MRAVLLTATGTSPRPSVSTNSGSSLPPSSSSLGIFGSKPPHRIDVKGNLHFRRPVDLFGLLSQCLVGRLSILIYHSVQDTRVTTSLAAGQLCLCVFAPLCLCVFVSLCNCVFVFLSFGVCILVVNLDLSVRKCQGQSGWWSVVHLNLSVCRTALQ